MSDNLRAEIEQWAKDWSGDNSFDPGMEGLGEMHAILDQDAIRAAAPTPTPPLVDVIAGVLFTHAVLEEVKDDTGMVTAVACDCDMTYRDLNNHAAHQARAVLGALTKAGGVDVQFGLNFGDEVSQQDTLEDVHDERDAILGWIGNDDVQRSDYGPLAPVTRTVLTHVGPWMAVEG